MTMRKELGISPCVIMFENHADLQKTIDEYTEYQRHMVEKYRDRLGVLLRQAGMPAISQSLQSSSQGSDQPSANELSQEQLQQIKKKEAKKQSDEKGWIVLEADDCSIKIAASSASRASGEVSVLFKIVEALNAKVQGLKISSKIIAELPSRGIKPDQRFLVVFKDGLPKQIIPTNETYASQAKFKYVDQFELTPLQRFF